MKNDFSFLFNNELFLIEIFKVEFVLSLTIQPIIS